MIQSAWHYDIDMGDDREFYFDAQERDLTIKGKLNYDGLLLTLYPLEVVDEPLRNIRILGDDLPKRPMLTYVDLDKTCAHLTIEDEDDGTDWRQLTLQLTDEGLILDLYDADGVTWTWGQTFEEILEPS